MDDAPRRTLIEIWAKHGPIGAEDARRCEGLLKDLCAEHRAEINVLVTALREGVVGRLLSAADSVPWMVLITRETHTFNKNTAIAENMARWGVESWALALGIKGEGLDER